MASVSLDLELQTRNHIDDGEIGIWSAQKPHHHARAVATDDEQLREADEH
ncbi:MAG TPA: hypothetical protein VEJ87_14765 [Acidimicrobiales bacterium]|nr:hypothetical protein [Acidimicrobiales bacterium]